MKTEDLGQGWFATANDDGTFTVRNPDQGQRIDLSAESADLFVTLYRKAEAEVKARRVTARA